MVVFYSSCGSWLEVGGGVFIPLPKSNRLRGIFTAPECPALTRPGRPGIFGLEMLKEAGQEPEAAGLGAGLCPALSAQEAGMVAELPGLGPALAQPGRPARETPIAFF